MINVDKLLERITSDENQRADAIQWHRYAGMVSEQATEMEGVVTEAKYAYQRKAYLKPIEHHYEAKGEKPYIKYVCPICEMLGNHIQISQGLKNCSFCGVNLWWKDDE